MPGGFRWCTLICILTVVRFSGTLSAQSASGCTGSPELESALQTHPSTDSYNALGVYFGGKHQYSCAISAFESALRLAPNAWESHYNLAIALNSIGNAKRAYEEMQTASHLNPEAPQVHLGLGLVLGSLQQPDAAINEFQAVLKVDPKSIPALDGVAKQLTAGKKYSAAIYSLRDAPPNEELQMDLAIAYSRNGEPTKASQVLSTIVKENPANEHAHVTLGIVYTQESRYHEAADEFQAAQRLDPVDDLARVSYIKTLIILRQYSDALPAIQEYLRLQPHTFDALELAGEVQRGLGNYPEAETLLEQAVAINPNSYNACYFLGVVLAKLGKPAEARMQLEKAVQLDPTASEAHFQLAGVLRSLGQESQAREELKIVQQKKEEHVEQDVAITQANEANQYLQSGDPQRASEMYQRSIVKDANNSRTYYDLALALDRQGKYGEERQALAKAIELDAKFAPAHNQIGFLNLQAGKTAEAENEFRTAISLDPQNVEAQNNLTRQSSIRRSFCKSGFGSGKRIALL
jgi:tetratricopeptide (TPR) repeat protein